MNITTLVSLILFILAGVFQILYSRVVLELKNTSGIKLKLKKFSSYSYSRKYLKALKADSPDDEFLSKSVDKILLYENLSVLCFVGTFLVFITGSVILGF